MQARTDQSLHPLQAAVELTIRVSKGELAKLAILVLLKTIQRLGYFIAVPDVPRMSAPCRLPQPGNSQPSLKASGCLSSDWLDHTLVVRYSQPLLVHLKIPVGTLNALALYASTRHSDKLYRHFPMSRVHVA
jgi:hypothetical protein